jgi:hypothetical protein
MKTLSLLSAACLLSLCVHAQTIGSLSGGVNFPVGAFRETSRNEALRGSGKTGFVTNLSAQRTFYKSIGLATTLRYTINEFNKESVDLAPELLTAQPWKAYSALLGPVASLTRKKLIMNITAQAGYSYLARHNFDYYQDHETYTEVRHEAHGSIAFSAALRFSYAITNNFSCGIATDYFTAKHIVVENVKITDPQFSEPQESTRERSFAMPSVSSQVFVAYRF